MNEWTKSELIVGSWTKVSIQKWSRQWKGGVNECPVPNIFDWPDINSSEGCVVSHSHRTRHDIMLQSFFKNTTSLWSLSGEWVSEREGEREQAEEADYSSWRWCQTWKQTGVIIDAKHRLLGTTTSTEHARTHLPYILYHSKPCVQERARISVC